MTEDTTALQRRTLRVLMGGVIMSGAAMAGGYAGAAVLAEEITGSRGWATFTGASLTLGSAATSVPLARLMSRRGRRPGLRLGWAIGGAGATLAFVAALSNLYPVLVVGIIGIGAGNSANLAARYAAADLAGEEHRARAIGTLVWASTFGSVLGPTIALGFAGTLSEALGMPELAGPYLLGMILFGAGTIYIDRMLRPDPLVVAGGLTDERQPWLSGLTTAFGRIGRVPPARLAIAAMVVGHAVMVGVMTLTPLHMKDGDHELRIVGFVISLHIIGMYAFSPLVGWLVDRVGSRATIAAAGVMLLVGAELAAHTDPEDSIGVFIGLFLIGLGWSFGVIAGSALLTSSFPVSERVSIQGAADLAMTGAGAIGGLAAGPLAAQWDYHFVSHYAGLMGGGLTIVATLAISGAVIARRAALDAGV